MQTSVPMDADVPVADAELTAAARHQARLAEAVRGLRTRAGTGELERWLLIIGGTLVPLGFIVILLGWWGVARKPQLYSQLSYLASGGLIGLGLVFTGGFVYFAYWLTRLIRDGRRENASIVDALNRIEAALASGAAGAAGPSDGAAVAGVGNGDTPLVATRNGTMYHRTDCPVVANRPNLRRVTPGAKGMHPCKICEPPV